VGLMAGGASRLRAYAHARNRANARGERDVLAQNWTPALEEASATERRLVAFSERCSTVHAPSSHGLYGEIRPRQNVSFGREALSSRRTRRKKVRLIGTATSTKRWASQPGLIQRALTRVVSGSSLYRNR
jgi:hypothetical protein